ncbi:MAG: hypothetical protein ACTSQJ_19850 [Promethearchaeota archaeon]
MLFIILEVPEAFPEDYYQGISLICWFIVIGLFFLAFILFFSKGLKTELKSLKMSYFAYGVVSLMLGLTRIFFIVAVYIPENYDFYTTLGYISGISGMIFWLYIVETYLVKKTKRIFTIICSISLSISIIALFGAVSRDLALDIQFILLPFALAVIVLLYIYMIVKTTGTVRVKAIWVLVGLALIAVAQVLDGQDFISAFPNFPLIITPLIMMAGILIFMISQLYYER